MATSTVQTVATVPVYDYYLPPGDPTLTNPPGLAGKRVKVTLAYDKARTISPVTWLENLTVYSTLTDKNGFWQVNLVPTDNITPSGTYYIVEVEGYLSYKINPTQAGVPGIGWQSAAILLDIPASLTPAGQTIAGPLTVNGLLSILGGASFPNQLTWVPVITPHGTATLTPGAHADNHAIYTQFGKFVVVSWSQLMVVTGAGAGYDGADITLPVNAGVTRNTLSGDMSNRICRTTTGGFANTVSLFTYDSSLLGNGTYHFSFAGVYQSV
jgi:hypothetical protein